MPSVVSSPNSCQNKSRNTRNTKRNTMRNTVKKESGDVNKRCPQSFHPQTLVKIQAEIQEIRAEIQEIPAEIEEIQWEIQEIQWEIQEIQSRRRAVMLTRGALSRHRRCHPSSSLPPRDPLLLPCCPVGPEPRIHREPPTRRATRIYRVKEQA